MATLIYPMFVLFLLSGTVLLLGLRARITAVKSGNLPLRYFRLMQEGTPPEDVTKTSRNFSNLFEAPVLFYAVCLAAMLVHLENQIFLILAWIYVALRVAHTMVHIGSNHVVTRMRLYAASWLILTVLWTMLVIHVGSAR